ncbi:MarR family winged helix-turn-helix transcriptional regulator [Pengzhenrongella sp.]|jgi:DNA-binding MarR family transcriptional regulator|uniref:MarR family winged helix-turn-helix transcriptional regulator n=1 Tax=Pengzhenrongella sp. TaxID=2888820 RepID=UPI002F9469B7
MSDPTTHVPAGPTAAAGGPVSYAIFRVARLHREQAGKLLREVGLYPGQEILMMHLWDTGPQRQADLVRLLDSDAATMTRAVQRLERAGFVRRTPSPTDRRSTIIEATPASAPLRTAVEQIWEQLEQATTGGLDAAGCAATIEALGVVERNLIAVCRGDGRACPSEDSSGEASSSGASPAEASSGGESTS